MYVPIIKNKNTELDIIKNHMTNFDGKIIPLIEIVSKQQKKIFHYEKGKRVLVEGLLGNKSYAIEDYSDVTLNSIRELAKIGLVFVQYFRYDFLTYQSDMDDDIREMAYKLAIDLDDYLFRTINLYSIDNVIPVFIIKPEVNNGDNLKNFYAAFSNLKLEGKRLAIRIDMRTVRRYTSQINNILALFDSNDFVFYDYLERKVSDLDLKYIDFESVKSKKIVIHSYRKRDIVNFEYSVGEHETAFDTKFMNEYRSLGFDGFGDFLGLPDNVPYSKARAKYSAAFIYDLEENKYISYRSEQTGKINQFTGRGGDPDFPKLRSMVLNSKRIRSKPQFDNCPGIEYINIKLINGGRFSHWKRVTVLCHLNAMLIKFSLIKK